MSLKTRKLFLNGAIWLAIIIVCVTLVYCGIKLMSIEGNYSLDERLAIVFGWGINNNSTENKTDTEHFNITKTPDNEINKSESAAQPILSFNPITNASTNNCTVDYGLLMLINPNFMVEDSFIAARRNELISLKATYGIQELNAWNGDTLIDAEAGPHLNDMLTAYTADYPGHEMQTVSCFRSEGTSCGRLCMPTGASDHHTGLTCDLVDASYGTTLDTSTYEQHPDWQWLHENSYKYGFLDRFPENWAGGLMSEPMNVDENGSTGLFETWHYRYVGIEYATEIATGKYNDGNYDSLEHYLKARGLVTDLGTGLCK